MNLRGLFRKKVPFFGLDVGFTSAQCVEFDCSSNQPVLTRCLSVPFSSDVYSGYIIQNAEKAAEALSSVTASLIGLNCKGAVSVPGPSVFTKRIKVPKVSLNDLPSTIQLEAGNFIPHNLSAVKLDFHIYGSVGDQLDVLVIAVKNEVLDSYVDALRFAGLQAGIVDVDFFALQNIFELNYPEYREKNIALINIGARFSVVNICRKGESLIAGDMSI